MGKTERAARRLRQEEVDGMFPFRSLAALVAVVVLAAGLASVARGQEPPAGSDRERIASLEKTVQELRAKVKQLEEKLEKLEQPGGRRWFGVPPSPRGPERRFRVPRAPDLLPDRPPDLPHGGYIIPLAPSSPR
jgi:outer membrane murein-binding lipoprotein Lpp